MENKKYEFNFTMLGARRVGKTSLLAAMYDKLTDDFAGSIIFTRDATTSSRLSEKLVNLKEQVTKSICRVSPTLGIEGGSELEKYKFKIGFPSKDSTEFIFNFTDYPGGWLKPESGKTDFVRDLVRENQAVLIAIDSPAMMEAKGRYNDSINQPEQIFEILQKSIEAEKPKLVLFCPVKAESYILKGQADDLISKVKENFRKSINHLKSFPDVTAAIVSVQTLGCLVFSRIEESQTDPTFLYKKTRPDAKYAPQNCEQPLVHLTKFFLNMYLKREKSPFQTFFDAIMGLFVTLDPDEKLAIEKLNKSLIQNGEGIQILQ